MRVEKEPMRLAHTNVHMVGVKAAPQRPASVNSIGLKKQTNISAEQKPVSTGMPSLSLVSESNDFKCDSVRSPTKPRLVRPWSGVLSSKPLWGSQPQDRPVAMEVWGPAAYRNMQPDVKQLLSFDDFGNLIAVKTRLQKARHGLASGLGTLLAESNERYEKLEEVGSCRILGRGSRKIRAELDREKRIQERMERLQQKKWKSEEDGDRAGQASREHSLSREISSEGQTATRKPTVLTGWIPRTQSHEANQDIPSSDGKVQNISRSPSGNGLASQSCSLHTQSREPTGLQARKPKQLQREILIPTRKSSRNLDDVNLKSENSACESRSLRSTQTQESSLVASHSIPQPKAIAVGISCLPETESRAAVSRTRSNIPSRNAEHRVPVSSTTSNAAGSDRVVGKRISCIDPANSSSSRLGSANQNTASQMPREQIRSFSSMQQSSLRRVFDSASGDNASTTTSRRVFDFAARDNTSATKALPAGVPPIHSSEIDMILFLGAQTCSSTASIETDMSTQEELGRADSGQTRWADRLQLGACVLQRSFRCMLARVVFRARYALLAADMDAERQRKDSAAAFGGVAAMGKLKRRVAVSRAEEDKDAQDVFKVESITNSISLLRAHYLHGRMKEFLNLLDASEETFEAIKMHPDLQADILYHFQDALARADAFASLSQIQNDNRFEWEPVFDSQMQAGGDCRVLRAATRGQYVKILDETCILKAGKDEDAKNLARSLSDFMTRVTSSVHMPEDKLKKPKIEFAAKWLRVNDYDVAHAFERYEKLLEASKSWTADNDMLLWPNHFSESSLDAISELENRGMRLLRAGNGAVLEDQWGGAVALLDVHKMYVKNRHTLANIEALIVLFWHSLTTDMSQAVFKGVTVVANMTEVHLNGGFNFTVARHLHLFVSKVFPGKMINQVCFYGAQGLYGAGFLTAAKLVFPLVYSRITHIESKSGEGFTVSKVKAELAIADPSDQSYRKATTNLLTGSTSLKRSANAFARMLSQHSQTIELERNNVVQQVLLYRDGWYGHYPLESTDQNARPIVERGSAALNSMRKKRSLPATEQVVSVDEVKGLSGGVKNGGLRARIVHAQSLAKACTGRLASQCRKEIRLSGGIRALIDMIDRGNDDEKNAASFALAKTCIQNPENARQAFLGQAIISLMNVANCGPEGIRANACEAISEICLNHPPACAAAHEAHCIHTLVTVMRNGLVKTQQRSLMALAAVCAGCNQARTECALSDAWMVVFDCLKSPNVDLQSAAAKVMQALFLDVNDPNNIIKRVREMDGFRYLSEILHSESFEAHRHAASALAQSVHSDVNSVPFLLRGGAVHAMLAVLERYQCINDLMGAMKSDSEGKCRVKDVQETWASHEAYSANISVHQLRDFLHMLSPEDEDRVLVSDWFGCQYSILRAMEITLNMEGGVAEDAIHQVLQFPLGLKLLFALCSRTPNHKNKQTKQPDGAANLQETALGALSGMLKSKDLSFGISMKLIELQAIRPMLNLLKGSEERIQTAVLRVLLNASTWSHQFREVADLNGICHLLTNFKLQNQNSQALHEGHMLAEKLLNLFTTQEISGLLHIIQTGTHLESETAAAALWHMAAVHPSKQASLKANPNTFGILQSVAFCPDKSADASAADAQPSDNDSRSNVGEKNAKLHTGTSPTHGESRIKGSYTEVTRRNALNVLKILGHAEVEAHAEAEETVLVKKRKKQSKLRAFLEYQTMQQMMGITQEVVIKGRPLVEDMVSVDE